MSMHMSRYIRFSLFDASWWLMGFALWAITLGAAEITTECNATHHKFRFPGWLSE